MNPTIQHSATHEVHFGKLPGRCSHSLGVHRLCLTAGRGEDTSSSTGSQIGSIFTLHEFCVEKRALDPEFMVAYVSKGLNNEYRRYCIVETLSSSQCGIDAVLDPAVVHEKRVKFQSVYASGSVGYDVKIVNPSCPCYLEQSRSVL
jgi:hypothetical protein